MVTTSMGQYVFKQVGPRRLRSPVWNFQRTREVTN